MYNFKTINNVPIDILEYVAVQKAKHGQQLKVHIGTDSASREGFLHYFLVVAFRYGTSGAHFVYHKEKVPIFTNGKGKPDIFTKLWKEADMSVDLCEHLVGADILPKGQITIEMDYNGIKETPSTNLISVRKGWANGMGYTVITKHESKQQIAVKAANYLSQP